MTDDALERLSLTGDADRQVGQLSGGQRQRVMIARALMHRPDVLFLDEPANGLDPSARIFVHERVAELHRDGTAVVITTHDMEEATKLCHRVGIVDHGRMFGSGHPGRVGPHHARQHRDHGPGAALGRLGQQARELLAQGVPSVARVEILGADDTARAPATR